MAETLYNKYRPRSFDDLIGQSQASAAVFLRAGLRQGKLPPALFIHGPSGTGKTTIARIVAASLNCSSTEWGDPCGTCEGCRSVFDKDGYTLVDGSVDTGIDAMREIIQDISLPFLHLKHKVVVFDEMHNLSKQAQDCLLTTVETPPRETTIAFCTTEPRKVIKTLKTRCVPLALSMPERSTVVNYLQELAELEGSELKSADIEERLGSYESIRDAVCRLELLLQGQDPETVDEGKEESAFRTIARMISNRKCPPPTELKSLFKKCRADQGARAGIIEYLHACILNSLDVKGKREDLRWWKDSIKILGSHESTDLPAFLTTDLMDVFTTMSSKSKRRPD